MTDLPALTTVAGSVLFLERIALPPGSVLSVRLLDVSRADAPALVLAASASALSGQVPAPYALTFDALDLPPHASLTVWARLRTAIGTWQSTSHNPVDLASGAAVKVIVKRVSGS